MWIKKIVAKAKSVVGWASEPVATAVAVTIPVAVIEQQREKAEDRRMKERRRQQLHDLLMKERKDYSMCMSKAAVWHRTHAAPGEAFVAAMLAPTIDAEAADVNACRSLCKEYWRAGRELVRLDIIDEEKQELEARHARFVALFQPLDKLPGYDARDMLVYKPLVPAPGPPTTSGMR